MARKKRDYKAEYAAAKRRATSAGYKSERQYKRARRELQVPRNASPIPRKLLPPETNDAVDGNDREMSRLRREAKAWSRAHSHSPRSRYSDRMPDATVRRYHRTFVDQQQYDSLSRKRRASARRRNLRDWLIPDWMTQTEWESKYTAV